MFSWSYRHLPAEAARAFRLIGLHPGPDLDAYAVAALTGTPPTQASRCSRCWLAPTWSTAVGAGRYGLHDLLRAYAAGLAAAGDAGPSGMPR